MDPKNSEPGADEARVRAILRTQEGWDLQPEQLKLEDGILASVDGIDRAEHVVVESVGWRGNHTSTLGDKMVADAAKLAFLRKSLLGEDYRTFLVCCGSPFAASFRDQPNASGVRKWAARVIKDLGVQILEVPLASADETAE